MRAPKLQFECDVPFAQLAGDGPVRHCASCDKTVTDISALNEEETRQVLAKGGCISFLRTHDGQLASSKKRSLQVLRPAAMAAAFAAAACQSGDLGTRSSGAPAPIDASASQPVEHTDEPRLMGEFAPSEPTTPPAATPDAAVPHPTRGRVGPTEPAPSTGAAPEPPPPHRTAGVPMPPPQSPAGKPLPPAK